MFLRSFKAHPRLGQRLCFIFSLLSSAAFAQSPFFEITQKPAQVAVTTAHPMATEAALKMLQQGGSAIDAAIAAGVPIKKDEELAALLGLLDLDDQVPRSLYTLVAEVLVYTYWLKGMKPGDEKAI